MKKNKPAEPITHAGVENTLLTITQVAVEEGQAHFNTGAPRLQFTVDIKPEAVAALLQLSPDDHRVALALRHAQHAVAAYLRRQGGQHVRMHGEALNRCLVAGPELILPAAPSAEPDNGKAHVNGWSHNGKTGRHSTASVNGKAGGDKKADIPHMQERLQKLADRLAAVAGYGVEHYQQRTGHLPTDEEIDRRFVNALVQSRLFHDAEPLPETAMDPVNGKRGSGSRTKKSRA